LSPLLVNEAGSTLVVTGTTLLLVLVKCMVLPLLTLVIVVTTSEMELDVIWVKDAEDVSVTVLVDCSVELVSSAELEGVWVDVVVMTVVRSDEVPGRVIVEDVVIVVAEVVSDVVAEEVSLEVGVAVPESVAESVAELLEPEPPVLNATLWRLNRAMASSRGSAVTTDALSKPKRRRANDRIVNGMYSEAAR